MPHNSLPHITEDEILDLLPGYVLGILELNELQLVNDYINKFPYIANRVAQLEELTAVLAFTASPQVPPLPKLTLSESYTVNTTKAVYDKVN